MAGNTILNKISDQASAMRDWLGQWATANGGTAVVVFNLTDLWSQSSQSTEKPQIYICYMGENSRGDFSVANAEHRVDRQWGVLVKRGRGFYNVRGTSLTETTAEIPFYDAVETVRDLLRRMLGISMELPTIDYKGIQPMSQGNMVIDAYLISFSTANDIPAILTSPDDSPTSP